MLFPQVEVRLVDGVLGKAVWSKVLQHASAPVHAVRQENTLVLTYWNTKVCLCRLQIIACIVDEFVTLCPLITSNWMLCMKSFVNCFHVFLLCRGGVG